jgi:epoxyqueuosine reductase
MAVSAELEPAVEVTEKPSCPADCRRCIDACPTGALYEPFKMDPLRCIAFNTYGPSNFPGAPADIPPAIREKMGSWIYGCDICQDACPHNAKRLGQKLVPDIFLEHIAPRFDPALLIAMDDRYFLETVQQVLYGYIWEKKFIQRNAAIALGNSGDSSAVTPLSRAMEDPEEMVRRYSAWGLGRLGGEKAKKALELSLSRENSTAVKTEIENALESCR